MYLFLPSRHLIKYLTDAMENHRGNSLWPAVMVSGWSPGRDWSSPQCYSEDCQDCEDSQRQGTGRSDQAERTGMALYYVRFSTNSGRNISE